MEKLPESLSAGPAETLAKLKARRDQSQKETPWRILILEHNVQDARQMAEAIESCWGAQVEVRHLKSVKHGLEELTRGSVDVILLGLIFSTCQGTRTFDQIRAQAGETPVIVLSGLPLLQVDYGRISSQAYAFFTKGQIETDDLLETVQSAVCLSRLREITRRSA